MKRLNPTWGGQRISDELAKTGYSASKVTVLKYLKIYGLHHPPQNLGPSWREVINNHKFKVSIDFTSLISLLGYQIYIFVMINLDTKKLIFMNATYSPSLEWVKQQFRNDFFNMDGKHPALCIGDRDQIFQGHFEKMIKDYFYIKLKHLIMLFRLISNRPREFALNIKRQNVRFVFSALRWFSMISCRGPLPPQIYSNPPLIFNNTCLEIILRVSKTPLPSMAMAANSGA